jgi:hypothetical protein
MISMAKINTASALVKFCMDIPTINEGLLSEINFVFYRLGSFDEPILFDKNSDIKASGKTEIVSFEKLLSRTVKEEQNFLFLSDGLFELDDVSKFTQIIENHPDMQVVPVAIGADAYKNNLKKISSCNKIFYPEDIMQALETFYSGGDGCPGSIGNINFSVQSDEEESWDA